jgi:hypothetical protein
MKNTMKMILMIVFSIACITSVHAQDLVPDKDYKMATDMSACAWKEFEFNELEYYSKEELRWGYCWCLKMARLSSEVGGENYDRASENLRRIGRVLKGKHDDDMSESNCIVQQE